MVKAKMATRKKPFFRHGRQYLYQFIYCIFLLSFFMLFLTKLGE